MTISKTKSSFYRRLYVAYLIDSGTASVPEIMAATGMPRRTAQDTIAALEELDIVCEFEQRRVRATTRAAMSSATGGGTAGVGGRAASANRGGAGVSGAMSHALAATCI